MLKTELPPDSTIVLKIVLFQSVVYILSSLHQRTLIKKQRIEKPTISQRPPSNFAFSALFIQMILVFFLYISYIDGWNFESVGLKFELSPILSLIVAVICYTIFVLGLNKILKVLQVYEDVEDASYRTMLKLIPRQKLQKIIFLLAVWMFNPLTEELMFRGILVHQLGIFINNHWLAIILGLIVNIGNHIYQGRLQIITHTIFYIFVVSLLYSPIGLIGAIGFHFAGDIYPFVSLKRDAINYRNRRRKKRAA